MCLALKHGTADPKEASVMCRRRRTTAAAHCLVVFFLAIGALMAAPAAAQSITGTILGNVTDGDGLALPGATVTATNTETGATRTVVTDGQGSYLISALQIGLYRVDVTMSGFRSFQQEQFSLSSAQNARVDARWRSAASRSRLTSSPTRYESIRVRRPS